MNESFYLFSQFQILNSNLLSHIQNFAQFKMIGLPNQDKSTAEGRQEYARKRKPEYYSSSSSSSELETLTKDGDSLPHASNKENINKNDKIQGYREQIAQIKKLISGTGHQQYASKVADAPTEPDTRPGARSGASSDGRAALDLETNAHSQLGHQALGDPAQANHSIRQSTKNQPSQDSNLVDSRMAAEPWVHQNIPHHQLQSQLPSYRYQEESPSHPRSPPTAPLESKYGRRRQCELLAEEDRRRTLSRGKHLSFEDAQSLQKSSNGGARSGSYSVSGERAFQTTLTGATGIPAPTASQLNTASWNAALTPSQAGSKLSQQAGPPMHLNDLHSQESALKPKHEAVEGHYMNHAQLLKTAQSSKDPRNQHLYYSQNPEPQFMPAPLLASADDQLRVQAHSLQSQNLDRQTRNNLGPQTLKSSTDSFTQMQGDILRLQEKIRGLETRLNPNQAQTQVQSPQMQFINQLQQPQGQSVHPENRRAFTHGTQGKVQDEQSTGYLEELRALQLQQSIYQDMQRDMQIFDEATACLPASLAAAHAEILQKKSPSTLATQPGLGTTTTSMSTLSHQGAQNDYTLPLQRRSPGDDHPKPETQQSNGQQKGGSGTYGQTSLTTFGGDCQFSNSQIFQRSGQAHTRCDAADTQEPTMPSTHTTGTLAPSSFSNIQGSQYPVAAHTAQSQPSLQHDSIAKSLVERKEQTQYHQAMAPGTDLVNISSLTQTQKELHGASCYTSTTGYQGQRRSGLGRRLDEPKGCGRKGSRRSGSGVPMTSRSHSRSVTTGHKGNLGKMRSNMSRKSKTRLDGKLGRDHSRKKMQMGLKHQQAGHTSKQYRSRNRDEAAQLMCHQSDEDRASYRTYNLGRSSHRSHKTQKSTKSQRLSRQQHLQSMRGRSQSQKKQPPNYGERSNLQVQSQGSRRHSRTSKMSRHSEYLGKRRQSTAAKRVQRPMSGKAYSASDGHSGSYQHQDGASEYRHQEGKRVKNENFKLRQKLKVQDEANAELRLEIERLHEKLTYMDELHRKTQKQKVQYGKVLAQLESSEMIRMEQQDKIKELVNKVHKLKRQKRELQDKQNKQGEKGNRTGSMKLSASVAHFSKSKVDKRGKGNGRLLNSTKNTERGEGKLRSTKSQVNGTKKAYDTFQNNPSSNGLISEEQMGMINHEATQQLLQIQNLHHGLRTHSKSNSRTRKSAKKAAQIVGGRLVQDGVPAQKLQQPYINNAGPAGLAEANGFGASSGSCATNMRSNEMTMPNSLVQLKPTSKNLQKTLSAVGKQVDPCSALAATWVQHQGLQETMNMPASTASQPKIEMGSTLLSFNATEAPKTDLDQNRQQSKSASNGRSRGRLAGENMPRAEAGAPLNGFAQQLQNASGPSASGFGGTKTWNPGNTYATKNQLDLSQQHIHQQADDLYIRYRRLRDLERACEEKRNSNPSLSPPHAQMEHFGARRTSNDQVAFSASNHFSSHKGIEEYHARAQRAGRGRGTRQEPGLATEAEDMQPDTIVNIPIRTGLSSQQHDTRHDARTALCDHNRSYNQESTVHIEDLYHRNDQRASDGLDTNYGAPLGEQSRALKSRNGSRQGVLSRELDLHSSGMSASEYRNMRASKASMKHNGLSKDTIGSLGGYARLKEAPPSVSRRDISSTAVDVMACLRPTVTGTELKDEQARLSILQDSAGRAEHRSSLGMLSNDTEQISRRYLNLTGHAFVE